MEVYVHRASTVPPPTPGHAMPDTKLAGRAHIPEAPAYDSSPNWQGPVFNRFSEKKYLRKYINPCSTKNGDASVASIMRRIYNQHPVSLVGKDDISVLSALCLWPLYSNHPFARLPPPLRGSPAHPHFSAEGAAGNCFSQPCWWKLSLFLLLPPPPDSFQPTCLLIFIPLMGLLGMRKEPLGFLMVLSRASRLR